MFFIYGNLNFVPGGYDPVRIISLNKTLYFYLCSLPGTLKDLLAPFHLLLPPP
jgi:hypothetical protein